MLFLEIAIVTDFGLIKNYFVHMYTYTLCIYVHAVCMFYFVVNSNINIILYVRFSLRTTLRSLIHLCSWMSRLLRHTQRPKVISLLLILLNFVHTVHATSKETYYVQCHMYSFQIRSRFLQPFSIFIMLQSVYDTYLSIVQHFLTYSTML
jgi:hypothetical protein